MYTDRDVYVAFRSAQGRANDRGFRLPKSWEDQRNKLTPTNLSFLDNLVGHFNTTFCNIELSRYMDCGFELFKTFSYHNFLDKRVINLYIHKDKVNKRKIETSKTEIIDTFDFLTTETKELPHRPGYSTLQSYCKLRDGEVHNIVNRYMRGGIDTMTLVYCIKKHYITLTDDERAMLPYIVGRYRELLESESEVEAFIKQQEDKLNEQDRR